MLVQVHAFREVGVGTQRATCARLHLLMCMLHMLCILLRPKVMRYEEMGGAAILHFAVCSFDTFWRKKWADLGYASPNHRFRGGGGGVDQRANALSLGQRR